MGGIKPILGGLAEFSLASIVVKTITTLNSISVPPVLPKVCNFAPKWSSSRENCNTHSQKNFTPCLEHGDLFPSGACVRATKPNPLGGIPITYGYTSLGIHTLSNTYDISLSLIPLCQTSSHQSSFLWAWSYHKAVLHSFPKNLCVL